MDSDGLNVLDLQLMKAYPNEDIQNADDPPSVGYNQGHLNPQLKETSNPYHFFNMFLAINLNSPNDVIFGSERKLRNILFFF